jgi:hypothetical protein
MLLERLPDPDCSILSPFLGGRQREAGVVVVVETVVIVKVLAVRLSSSSRFPDDVPRRSFRGPRIIIESFTSLSFARPSCHRQQATRTR